MKNRFNFGENWKSFLKSMDEDRIDEAKASLLDWLGRDNLSGKTFLDIGSGSGLFSLAAKELGAKVHSFDYDKESVACTKAMKARYFPDDPTWTIEEGDALDEIFLNGFGKQDVVYSWGVLHHTGNMYKAIENAGNLVKSGGFLFIAIYNDQGSISRFWLLVKRLYNTLPGPLKLFVSIPFFVALWTVRTIIDFIRLKPFDQLLTYRKRRGMSPWHDAVDWVGDIRLKLPNLKRLLISAYAEDLP